MQSLELSIRDQKLEKVVPGYIEKYNILKQSKVFNLSASEKRLIILMKHDFGLHKIAELLSRSYKTVWNQQDVLMKKTKCNTSFALALKLKKHFDFL